jgi:hypothetical protein
MSYEEIMALPFSRRYRLLIKKQDLEKQRALHAEVSESRRR